MHDVPGQSKVTDLHYLALREEYVPGCKVSVHALKKEATWIEKDCSSLWCFGIFGFYLIQVPLCYHFTLLKHRLYVKMSVGWISMTAGYLEIITMKLKEQFQAAACSCMVIPALQLYLQALAPLLSGLNTTQIQRGMLLKPTFLEERNSIPLATW